MRRPIEASEKVSFNDFFLCGTPFRRIRRVGGFGGMMKLSIIKHDIAGIARKAKNLGTGLVIQPPTLGKDPLKSKRLLRLLPRSMVSESNL
jgi:hypothetical protein